MFLFLLGIETMLTNYSHLLGQDCYHPVTSQGSQMSPHGLGWIIVDSLDTMMVMNLTEPLADARRWLHRSLSYDQDHAVNTFETTIRMLGGRSLHTTSQPGSLV